MDVCGADEGTGTEARERTAAERTEVTEFLFLEKLSSREELVRRSLFSVSPLLL
jgi:hypothetical protein